MNLGPINFTRTDIAHDGVLHMRRWVAEIESLGSVRLHFIAKEDEDIYPHDHPFNFYSLILAGWYREERYNKIRGRYRFWGFHTQDGWVPWETYLGDLVATTG